MVTSSRMAGVANVGALVNGLVIGLVGLAGVNVIVITPYSDTQDT